MKSDKELANELDAKDRLRKRGYIQHTCESCRGAGMQRYSRCFRCEGKGYTWEAPLMRVVDPHIKLLRKSYPEQFPNS